MKAIRFSLDKLGTASRVTQQVIANLCTDPQISVPTTLSFDGAACQPTGKLCRRPAAD